MTEIHRKSGNPLRFLPALLILAAGFWIYAPVLHGDWLWDDHELIANNVSEHNPSQLWWIWWQPGHLVDYQPIKATVVCLQWFLWGNNTLGYHVTNLVLHLASALLVWRLLHKLGLKLAWLGGLLFAIHPVQVESVAWIAELKNTLSLPPFLLAMCCYIDYDRRGKQSDYFLAAGFFVVAMLCKASTGMFPFVILLYSWWRRGRIGWSDLKGSAPFFVILLVLGFLTVHFSRAEAIGHGDLLKGGFFSRLAIIGLAISFYLTKCLWPTGLLPLYPKPVVDPPTLLQFLPWPILGGAIGWMWIKRESWGRHALFGVGFFLINLVPVLGFIFVRFKVMAWSLDHLIYLPIIGLIGLAVAACEAIGERLPSGVRYLAIGIVVLAVAMLTRESHRYAKIFINQQTLWTYTLHYYPDAVAARNNLGDALLKQGRVADAIAQFREALRLQPDYAEAHNNFGNALVSSGKLPEAREQYTEALRLKPDYPEAHNGMGNAWVLNWKLPEAMEQYTEALRLRPDYSEAHNGLGNVLLQMGRLLEALAECEAALKLNPDYADAHCTAGLILAQMGRLSEAIAQFETASKLDPGNARIEQELELLRRHKNAASWP
jgi:protein O-mannosyl-transferase